MENPFRSTNSKKIVRIKNTITPDEIEVSVGMLPDVQDKENFEILSEPYYWELHGVMQMAALPRNTGKVAIRSLRIERKRMNHEKIKKLVLSAVFLAIGIVLPFLTGQIPAIGKMLLPMHIPVLLCGLICGWQYGLSVGLILPLLRSLLFAVPAFYPMAISMAFELATYGFVIGFLYGNSRWKCIKALYAALLTAMVCGRCVWGLVQVLLLGLGDTGFTMQAFLSGAFLTAIPGIVLQLFLIPAIMFLLNKTHLVPFREKGNVKIHAA